MGSSDVAWRLNGVTTTSSALDPSGSRLATISAGVTGFDLADLHANLGAVLNAGETALLSATRYDPYGLDAAAWDSGGGFPTAWGFQGRLDLSIDPNDPLYAWSARWYAPAHAAFTQLDTYPGTLARPVSLHRYLYGAANPWSTVDPSGHKFEMGSQDSDDPEREFDECGKTGCDYDAWLVTPSSGEDSTEDKDAIEPKQERVAERPVSDWIATWFPGPNERFESGPLQGCKIVELGLGLGLVWGGIGLDIASAAAELGSLGVATPIVVAGFIAGTASAAHGAVLITEACGMDD